MRNFKDIFSLKNKIAIVTGGYGHIGKYFSLGLRDFGAKVYVAARNKNKFYKLFSNEQNINFIELDILSNQSIKTAFKKIFDIEKQINILVNNAFHLVSNDPENMNELEFSKGLDGTLTSVFRCIKNIIPYMKNIGGNIINISSMYGIVSPDLRIYEKFVDFLNPPNYGAAKAGVIQLTKYYAVALAKYNIKVNCIVPGAFPSEEIQKQKKFMQLLEQKTPLKRIGSPEELVGTLLLLSSEASSYITGQSIVVDGGWSIW